MCFSVRIKFSFAKVWGERVCFWYPHFLIDLQHLLRKLRGILADLNMRFRVELQFILYSVAATGQ